MGNLLISIMPLILVPFLKYNLIADEFKAIFILESFFGYYYILSEYGLNVSATRDISLLRDSESAKDIISRCLSTLIIVNLILPFFFILISSLSSLESKLSIKNFDWIFFLILFRVISESAFPKWYYYGREKFKRYVFITAFLKIMFLITLISISLFYELTLLKYYLITFLFSLITLFSLYQRIAKEDTFSISFKKTYLKLNKNLFLIRIFSGLYINMIPFISLQFLAINGAALIGSVDKVIRIFNKILTPISQVFFTNLNKLKSESIISYRQKSRRIFYLFVFTPLIFILVSIIFFPLIDKLFLTQFVMDIKFIVFLIQLIILIPISIGTFFSHLKLNLNFKEKYFLRSVIVGFISLIVISPILSFKFDVIGFSASILVVELIVMLSLVYFNYRKLRHL